jgi:hypothetical protein
MTEFTCPSCNCRCRAVDETLYRCHFCGELWRIDETAFGDDEMDAKLEISEVRFSEAGPGDLESGILGWLDFVLNRCIRVSGVCLRRTRSGQLTLSYPTRIDGNGREHFVIRPITDEARRAIEAQVFAALGHLQESS